MSLATLSEQYLEHRHALGRSALTIKNERSHLRLFLSHLEKLGVTEPQTLRRDQIEDFLDELTWAPSRHGVPIQVQTRNVRLSTVKGFARWLFEYNYAGLDAAAKVVFAREPMPLPRNASAAV